MRDYMALSQHEKELGNQIRKNIIEQLELIASREQQLEYQRTVPIADVTAELFCGWDYNESFLTESEFWQFFFSEEELKATAEFDAVLTQVGNQLSADEHRPHITKFVDTPLWQYFSEAARKALERFPVTE